MSTQGETRRSEAPEGPTGGAWLWGQSHSAWLGRARPQGFVLQPYHQVYPEQLSGRLRPQHPGRAWHPRPPFLPMGEINPVPQCEQSEHPSLCPRLHWSDVKPLCLVTTSHGCPQRTQKGVHQSLVFPQAHSSSDWEPTCSCVHAGVHSRTGALTIQVLLLSTHPRGFPIGRQVRLSSVATKPTWAWDFSFFLMFIWLHRDLFI